MKPITKTPQEWLMSGNTGVSSLSIFYVMTGVITTPTACTDGNFDIPNDTADFGRCYRLLKAIPEWKEQLHKIAVMLPKWTPLIKHWAELEALFEKDTAACNAKLHELYPLCMKADGWQQTSKNS